MPYPPPPAHISVRSAYSTCPPRPQSACQPALGLVDDCTHALASIVPPLRGRREDGRVLLASSSSSSCSSSSVSPYHVALRHCQVRWARHYERARKSETRTPRLNAAGRQRALLCGIGRATTRNCHLSLAPGTWPYLGGTNAALDHSLGVQVWKSKMVRRGTVLRQKPCRVPAGGHQLAAAGIELAIYTSSPASRVRVPATRMQSHPQEMQLRLHHNPARLAVFTPGHSGAIYRASRTCSVLSFHLPSSPDSKVSCCAFPLRPVQGGKLRFSRASTDALLASAESPGEI